MKSRFGLGRSAGDDAPDSVVPRPEPGDAENPEMDLEDGTSPADELPRPMNETTIRPDLGPPAPGPQSAHQPGSGLGLVISVAVSAVIFVLAIYATGSPTANPVPLAQTTNALYWAVAAIALIGSGVGAIYADRTASRASSRAGAGPAGLNTAWIVPVVATAAAVVLVATFHNTTMIVAGPLIAFLGNAGSLLSRDLLDDADDAAQRTAVTIHALVIHSVSYLALTAIYLNKFPTPITALVAGVASTLLAIEALDRMTNGPAQRLLYPLLVGGAVAAAVSPLMWWLTHGLTGGAVLFVVFYWAVGVLQTSLERSGVQPRTAIFYGLVPLAMFLLLAITA